MPEARTDASTAPWWLSDGDEACTHCSGPYHLAQERRCRGCDRASCAQCIDRRSGLCADCTAEAEAEAEARGSVGTPAESRGSRP